MADKKRVQPQRTPTIELGIEGRRVPVHSHLAYLWETDQQFVEAVGFIEAGIRDSEHCIVIGEPRDNQVVHAVLREHGVDLEDLKLRNRLTFLERRPWAAAMLKEISATVEAALAAGAPIVRLFGNVVWEGAGRTSDAELLVYEARMTEIAERFPIVVLCLHEVRSMTGLILRHGVFSTHPQVMAEGEVLGNPYFVPLDRFLERLGALAADVAERQLQREVAQRAELALQRSYEELRALSTRLQTVREEESKRIAREVHDEIGQLLTALGMDVAWLKRKLASLPTGSREELGGKLGSMSRLLDAAVNSVQRIVTELRPVILDELGLEAAVDWYVAEFEQRTGIACRLQADLERTAVDPDRSTALFRILQEALTNVARHADATAVEIRLAADDDRLVLTVTDNGRGIAEERIRESRSLGLIGMRERARSLGGDVLVRTANAGGTVVEVVLPR